MILILTALTGLVYPIFITGVSRVFFHDKANGSLVEKNGIFVGSELIGQPFDSAAYFWPRPSAINYQPIPSGASNLSWTSEKYKRLVEERREAFIKGNMLNDTIQVPVEMLCASGSGLDPHISSEAALLQAERVWKARKFNDSQKQKLIELIKNMTRKPQYGVFGEDRINVFLLNLELDKIK
jgi:potassium-transporting ATPase KdpC subunit